MPWNLKRISKVVHVYKEIWTPELGEQLNMEPDNRVDKFTIFVKKDQAVVGYLKKGDSEKFAKRIFYFFRSNTYSSCYAKISRKRCNLKDGEGLQVPCKMIVTGQKSICKHIKTWITKNKWITITQVLEGFFFNPQKVRIKQSFLLRAPAESFRFTKSLNYRSSNYRVVFMRVC